MSLIYPYDPETGKRLMRSGFYVTSMTPMTQKEVDLQHGVIYTGKADIAILLRDEQRRDKICAYDPATGKHLTRRRRKMYSTEQGDVPCRTRSGAWTSSELFPDQAYVDALDPESFDKMFEFCPEVVTVDHRRQVIEEWLRLQHQQEEFDRQQQELDKTRSAALADHRAVFADLALQCRVLELEGVTYSVDFNGVGEIVEIRKLEVL